MLHERLAQGAAEFGEAPCIIEAESGRTLTYAQCLAAVQALRRLLGTDESHSVVMLLSGGTVSALAWLATLSGGHTFLPLPPDAKSSERDRALRLAPADILLAEREEDAASFGQPFARVITRDECEAAIDRALDKPLPTAELLPPAEGRVCLMTSGSTGEPKGVFLTEAQIAWSADAIRRAHQLTSADRGLTVLPLFHVNAPVVSLCTSILAGGSVVIARRFSRTRFWGWIEQYQITWASIVPTILAMLLETERPAFLPGRLRFVRTASAPLPVVHLLAFERRFGIPVVETYGLSEAAATVSATPVPPGARKPGSVGLPVGVELRVCKQRPIDSKEPAPLVDVARGETGEICVRGPSVIAGYAGGAGAKSFQDGWFRTGDLGYQDEDRYLYITGRLRDVIIRGGENVAPREIEEVLLADPFVRDVAVVGQPDPLYGQQVVAYVVPKGRWTPEREAALRTYCAEHLSRFKIPETFIPVRILPRTRSGKIQRHRLQAMVSGGLRASVAASVSAGVTQTLARIRQVTQPITRPVKRAVESSSPRLYVARATPTGSRPGAADRRTASAQMRAVRMAAQPAAPSAAVHGANGHNGHNGHNGRPSHAVAPLAPIGNPRNDLGNSYGSAPAQPADPVSDGRAGGKRRPYLYELDPIRAVTALSVVGVHVLTLTMLLNATAGAQDIQIGLGSLLHYTREVFMFTTAFVLTYTYAGSKFDLKTFARKRGLGVVVPYILWSLLYLVLNRHGLSPVQFAGATVKALLSGDAEYQLYYILLTIQFYLLFPLLLIALPWMRRRAPLVLGVSCALELLLLGVDYAFVQVQPFASTSLGTFLNNYQDRFVLVYQFYFVLGALAALNLDRLRAFLLRWGPVITVALCVAVGLLWLNFVLGVWWLHQDVYYASSVLQPETVPYSLLVLAFMGAIACRWALARRASGKPRASTFWRTLADASFGIYLVHPLFLSFALAHLAPHMPAASPVALRVVLIWGFVAVGSSALSVALMKTPVLSRLVGRTSSLPSRTQQSASAGSLAAAGPVDAYATTPLSPVPVQTYGPRRNDARGLAITVTASSARHLSPQRATPRLVGTGTALGWRQSAGPAPQVSRHGSQLPVEPRAATRGEVRSERTTELAAGSVQPDAAMADREATPANGWLIPQIEASGLAEHGHARAGYDSAPDSKLDERWPERGPDSREQREERRRQALALRHQGWARKDIAAALGVSRSTVSYWFRREFLREREEGMSQDDMLENDTDGAPAAFAADAPPAADVTPGHMYQPSEQPPNAAQSQAPAGSRAEAWGQVERASVTANR